MGPILLTGSTGQVGGALVTALAGMGEVVAPTRSMLNLENVTSIRDMVRAVKPRWIVNPAAYTAVDKAETEPDVAQALNAEAPRILGEEAVKIGAVVLHFSTDYVFAGDSAKPYTERDEPGPKGVYGSTKLAGEKALAATGAAHLIFRTSWVYGATGKNFLLTILRAAAQRPELRIVADQHGAPTWSRDLARMAVQVMEHCEGLGGELAAAVEPLNGVYHAAGAGETTWFGFAEAMVAAEQALVPEVPLAKLTPITTAEYPTPAARPEFSKLDGSKLAEAFGFRFPAWQDSLTRVLAELHGH